jgi:hypothetical protein
MGHITGDEIPVWLFAITSKMVLETSQPQSNVDSPGGLSPEIKVSTLRHLATCQAVVLRSEIKVTFDVHNFSFASSLSHVWVTNPYPQFRGLYPTIKWL